MTVRIRNHGWRLAILLDLDACPLAEIAFADCGGVGAGRTGWSRATGLNRDALWPGL